MINKKSIGYSEDKKTIELLKHFADTRGLKLPAMMRQALYEYIRRKINKDTNSELHNELNALVNGE